MVTDDNSVASKEEKEAVIPDNYKLLVFKMDRLSKYMALSGHQVHACTARYLDHIVNSQGTLNIQSKHDYADIVEAIENYHNYISQYKDILTDDLFEFAMPSSQANDICALYKHNLVAQILYDIQRIQEQLRTLSGCQEIYYNHDYLLPRWHAELIHFVEFQC